MTFPPLVSIPADEDRDNAPKSHITKKDVQRFLIALPFIVIVLFYGYKHFKKQSDWARCAANMNAVYKAINLYANDHDGLFPPLASSDPATGTPYVNRGLVNTWVTQVFPYDPRPEIYRCPSAFDDETVATEAAVPDKAGGPAKRMTIYSSYGIYAPYGAANTGLLDQSGQGILLAETSNDGSRGAYNPMPFKDSSGAIVPFDGFSLGFDNSNTRPDAKSRYVTRLALRDSATGNFGNATARHENQGLHGITTSGSLHNMRPGDAQLNMRGGEPTGMWRAPAGMP
jgi:hypothetical protein